MLLQIRACIMRGMKVQPWLQDGAQYGEEGPALTLDTLLVRVATLRSDSLALFQAVNPVCLNLSSTRRLEALTIEAQDLDKALETWPDDLPEEWRVSTESTVELDGTFPGFLFDGTVHSYSSLGHATVWMRYRATSLIISSILIRLLNLHSTLPSSSPSEIPITPEIPICLENSASLATDICRSVPFFFNTPTSHSSRSESGSPSSNAEPTIEPRIATVLAWPLAVAVSTQTVPIAQKQWLRERLKTVAISQGDATLSAIAEREEFKF